MANPIYHKIEDVEFTDISGMDCEGIIEQDKNNQSYRLRVIKKRPAVKTVRVRYEPHVELFGDKGAFMPTIWGYNLKDIKKTLIILPLAFLAAVCALYPPLFFRLGQVLSNVVSTSIATIISYVLMVVLYGVVVFLFLIPIGVRYVRMFKEYLYLKKNAKSYTDREVLLDGIAPKY